MLFKVEVYRSDFNAEREARERIAGEKADLAEELAKFRKPTGNAIRCQLSANNPNSILKYRWKIKRREYFFL